MLWNYQTAHRHVLQTATTPLQGNGATRLHFVLQLYATLYRTVGTNIYCAFVHMDVPLSRQLTHFNQLHNVTEGLAVSEELRNDSIVTACYKNCSRNCRGSSFAAGVEQLRQLRH